MAQVTELEAALERAETNLRYSVIRSPIDGVVVSRDYDVGQTVAASFQAPTLFTIAEDLTRMQLTCDVDEADIGQVKVGQTVRFSVDTFPEREFDGTVAQIRLSPKITNNVVTYPVIVDGEQRGPDAAAGHDRRGAHPGGAGRERAAGPAVGAALPARAARPCDRQSRGRHGRSAGGGHRRWAGRQGRPGGRAPRAKAARDEARVYLAPAKAGEPLQAGRVHARAHRRPVRRGAEGRPRRGDARSSSASRPPRARTSAASPA